MGGHEWRTKMALKDGLYRVTFATPLGQGTGVAHLQDGKLHGGDSMMAYVGKHKEDGGEVEATVRVFQHSNVEGMTSVLGATAATLTLSGEMQGQSAHLTGTAPQAPGVTLTVRLDPLSG